MSLSHPDAQVQAILATLEDERDQAIIKAANATVRADALQAECSKLQAEMLSYLTPAETPKDGDVIDVAPVETVPA